MPVRMSPCSTTDKRSSSWLLFSSKLASVAAARSDLVPNPKREAILDWLTVKIAGLYGTTMKKFLVIILVFSVKLFINSMYSRTCIFIKLFVCAFPRSSKRAMYGRISNLRDCTTISIEKSRELRKSWNWKRMACFSSSDLSAKFKDEHRRIERMPPSFKRTMPSRTSLMGINSWVALVFEDIYLIIPRSDLKYDSRGQTLVLFSVTGF